MLNGLVDDVLASFAELHESRTLRLKDLRYTLGTTPLRAIAEHYTKGGSEVRNVQDLALTPSSLPLVLAYVLITALGLAISINAVLCIGYGLAAFISVNHGDLRVGAGREDVLLWASVVGLWDAAIVVLLSICYEKQFSLFQRLFISLGTTLISIVCLLTLAIMLTAMWQMGKNTYHNLYWSTTTIGKLDFDCAGFDSDGDDGWDTELDDLED